MSYERSFRSRTAFSALVAVTFVLSGPGAFGHQKSAEHRESNEYNRVAPEVGFHIVAPMAPDYGERPSFTVTKIAVTNMDRAVKFYVGVMGMEKVGENIARPPHPPMLTELMLRYPNVNEPWLVLVQSRKVYPEHGADGSLGFMTPNIKMLLARVRAGGFRVVRGPFVNPEHTRYIAILDDPDGHHLEVMQLIWPHHLSVMRPSKQH